MPMPMADASLLRNCRSLSEGRLIHAHIIRGGAIHFTFLANLLLQMYGRLRRLDHARALFDSMALRNSFSWNIMMGAYVHWGGVGVGGCYQREALGLFGLMAIQQYLKPDKCSFIHSLSASANLGDYAEGKRIHACMLSGNAYLESDTTLNNCLLNMYAKCCRVGEARVLFEWMKQRNVISWTTLIAGYAQNGHNREAIEIYEQMNLQGIAPNKITFVSALHACTRVTSSLETGQEIHRHILTMGLECDVSVTNSLITMYSKHNCLNVARSLFEKMPHRDTISWNAMITAYTLNGRSKEALKTLKEMESEGFEPDRITFLSVLEACATLACLENGKAAHRSISASPFAVDISIRNALINMYCKCGSVDEAWSVFRETPHRNAISWNSMIAAFAQNGYAKEALKLFECMCSECVPDRITFLSVIEACTSLASLEKGRQIHEYIVSVGGGIGGDLSLRNAIINMYGRCGSLSQASTIFYETDAPNVISWTAIIAAYALNGEGGKALELFRQMVVEGVMVDGIAFISILSACSHAGLLEEGRHYFALMCRGDHGLIPLLIEHFRCLIDLVGRTGFLDEAQSLITNMPIQSDDVTWKTFLSACQINKDFRRGFRAASQCEDAINIWELMKKGIKEEEQQQPGRSCIEVEDFVRSVSWLDEDDLVNCNVDQLMTCVLSNSKKASYIPLEARR